MPALLALALAIPVGTIKAADTGAVLYEAETVHQYVRVVERADGARALELNEGQAVHSLYRPGTYLTGDYWDGHLVLPFAGRRTGRRGGSRSSATPPAPSPAPTATTSRGTAVDAVEIDGELTELGRRYFDLRNPRMRTFAEDARPWLERSAGRLRRDHGRRLPPALHPLLPDHPRVLRAGRGSGWRRAAS